MTLNDTYTTYTYTKKDDGKRWRNDNQGGSYTDFYYYDEVEKKWKNLTNMVDSKDMQHTHYSYSIGSSNAAEKML